MSLKTEYKELETRAQKSKRYERVFYFLREYWIFSILIGVVSSILVTDQFLGREPEIWEVFGSAIIVLLAS